MLVFSVHPLLSTIGVLGAALVVGIVLAFVLTVERPVMLTDAAETRAKRLTQQVRLRLWWREERDTVYTGILVIGFALGVFLTSVQVLAWIVQAYL